MPKRTVGLAWRKRFTKLAAVKVVAEAIRACSLGEAIRVLGPAQKTQ